MVRLRLIINDSISLLNSEIVNTVGYSEGENDLGKKILTIK